MKKRIVAVAVAVASLTPLALENASAAECNSDSATMMSVSSAGQPVEFLGEQIGLPAITELWRVVSYTSGPHKFLGKAIAADQGWFGACAYPGIGIAAGSGYNWLDRNVTIWIWADGVDLAVARETIKTLVGAVSPTTTTSTTTTTTTTIAPEPVVAAAVVTSVSSAVSLETVESSSLRIEGYYAVTTTTLAQVSYSAVTQTSTSDAAPIKKIVKKKKVTKKTKCTKTKVCTITKKQQKRTK